MPFHPFRFSALPSLRLIKACILAIATSLPAPVSQARSAQETPPQLVIQQGQINRLGTIAFAHDGNRFATVSGRAIQIWNSHSGLVEQILPVNGTVESLAWSPDSSRLAAGGLTNETGYFRGLVMIWDTRSGRVLQDWRTGYAMISSLVWSADGQILATAGGGDFEGRGKRASARLWSRDGHLLHTLENYIASRAALVISRDGRKIALSFSSGIGGDDGTRIYDITTGKPLTPLQSESIHDPAFLPDGSIGEKPHDIPLPDEPGISVARAEISPDGLWLVTGSNYFSFEKPEPAFRVWRLDKQARRWNQVRQVAFNQSIPSSLSATSGVKNHKLAVGTYDGTSSVWDLRSGQMFTAVPGFPYATHIALSPEATHLAASFLWDVSGREPVRKARLTSHRAVAFSHDGVRLVDESGLLNVHTGVRTPMKVTDEEGGSPLVGLQSASFSADGELLATVDDTKSSDQLHLWNGKTGKFLRRLNLVPHVRGGRVAFAPKDANLSISGSIRYPSSSASTFLGLVDGKTGRVLSRWKIAADDPYGIGAIAFSPDGKH